MKLTARATHERVKQASRAVHIKKTFGPRSAARYLYRRGWSLSASLWLVAGASLREGCPDVSPWEMGETEYLLNKYGYDG